LASGDENLIWIIIFSIYKKLTYFMIFAVMEKRDIPGEVFSYEEI